MTGIVAAKRLDWGQRLQLEGLQPKLSDFAGQWKLEQSWLKSLPCERIGEKRKLSTSVTVGCQGIYSGRDLPFPQAPRSLGPSDVWF
jgi:hypothetical protein